MLCVYMEYLSEISGFWSAVCTNGVKMEFRSRLLMRDYILYGTMLGEALFKHVF